MNELLNKYRTLFVLIIAESLGYLVSRPIQLNVFLMIWIVMSVILLVSNMRKNQNTSNTPKMNDAGITIETNDSKTPQQKRDEAPSLYVQAITGSNRLYTIFVLLNIIAYLISIAFLK